MQLDQIKKIQESSGTPLSGAILQTKDGQRLATAQCKIEIDASGRHLATCWLDNPSKLDSSQFPKISQMHFQGKRAVFVSDLDTCQTETHFHGFVVFD